VTRTPLSEWHQRAGSEKALDIVRNYPNLCTNRYSNTHVCINSYRLKPYVSLA